MSAEKQAALVPIERWVRDVFQGQEAVAHGWLHTDRVRRNIRHLAAAEGVDPILADMAALLHDVGRARPGPESEHGARSAAMAGPILDAVPLCAVDCEAILYAVRWHNSRRADTPLLCILRDADMLDGLGAIGIIRAFMSRSHLPPYDPDDPFGDGGDRWPALYCSDQYLSQMAWYDYLNTETAREMACERFSLMQAFLSQVRRELTDEFDGWAGASTL
jgi:uncharacterized protein